MGKPCHPGCTCKKHQDKKCLSGCKCLKHLNSKGTTEIALRAWDTRRRNGTDTWAWSQHQKSANAARWTPEKRRQQSLTMIKVLSDPLIRLNMSIRSKALCTLEELQARSVRATDSWAKADHAERAKKISEGQRRDPLLLAKRSIDTKNSWADPKIRDKRLMGMKIIQSAPETRAQRSLVLSSKEVQDKRRATNFTRYGRADGPVKDTWGERKIEESLILHQNQVFAWGPQEEFSRPFDSAPFGKRWFKQCPVVGILVDFYNPDTKIVLEVDGCKVHACPKCYPNPDKWIYKTRKDMVRLHTRDQQKTEKMRSAGYKVTRIWECRIEDWIQQEAPMFF